MDAGIRLWRGLRAKSPSPGQFDHRAIRFAKARMVFAYLCSGVVPAHNVTLDLENVYQTQSDASRARNEFGFLRMGSIYPAQFQPTWPFGVARKTDRPSSEAESVVESRTKRDPAKLVNCAG